jgi:hypothetical protein
MGGADGLLGGGHRLGQQEQPVDGCTSCFNSTAAASTCSRQHHGGGGQRETTDDFSGEKIIAKKKNLGETKFDFLEVKNIRYYERWFSFFFQ